MVRTIVTSFDRRLTLVVADVSVAFYWPRNLLVNKLETTSAQQHRSRSMSSQYFIRLLNSFWGLHGRSVIRRLCIFETGDLRLLNFLNFHS